MVGTPAAEVSVTPDLVRALLAAQHPRFAHLSVHLAGEGWDNYTFRLGEDLAVRLPRRQAGVELLFNEQRWLGQLAPALSLPVPAPIAIGAPGVMFSWPWSIIPWIEGSPADQALLDADQGARLATFLRSLHQPAPAGAPVNPVRGVPLERRRERIDACLARLRASSDLITPAIDHAWREALVAPLQGERLWLHGDMHAQNVLSCDGRIAGVIDWGDMCAGDPATDLGAVWGVLPHGVARAAALRAYAPDDALLARARGWAVLFGATLYDAGRIDDPRHAAIGEATLNRLAEDL